MVRDAVIRLLLVACALVVAGVAAGTSAGARGTLDNCKLITQAELQAILRSPVQIRRGEGLTSCNFFWKGKHDIILSVGPAPLSGFQELLRQVKSDRSATVTTLSIAGNPAFEIDSGTPATAGYVRAIHAYRHGNMLQLEATPVLSKALLPSLAQLRQITAIVLTRF